MVSKYSFSIPLDRAYSSIFLTSSEAIPLFLYLGKTAKERSKEDSPTTSRPTTPTRRVPSRITRKCRKSEGLMSSEYNPLCASSNLSCFSSAVFTKSRFISNAFASHYQRQYVRLFFLNAKVQKLSSSLFMFVLRFSIIHFWCVVHFHHGFHHLNYHGKSNHGAGLDNTAFAHHPKHPLRTLKGRPKVISFALRPFTICFLRFHFNLL